MPVYVADPPSARAVVALDDLVAVLHRPSGATHLLAPPAPELLDALAEGPADAHVLLERLSRQSEGCHRPLPAQAASAVSNGR